jgi:hypothetical protein
MYERHHQPLLSRKAFLRRVARHVGTSVGIIAGSLGIGILGYRFLEHFNWIDALLNASMILGGMGPVGELKTTAGKIFASFYALYSGLIVLVAAGVIFVPVLHRFLHRFHLAEIDHEPTPAPIRRRRKLSDADQ